MRGKNPFPSVELSLSRYLHHFSFCGNQGPNATRVSRRAWATRPESDERCAWATFTGFLTEVGPLFEALDLLVLLASANQAAWRDAVCQIWPTPETHGFCIVKENGSESPRPIGVKVDDCGDGEQALAYLRKLIKGVHVISAEYCRLRQHLETELNENTTSTEEARPRLCVRLAFNKSAGSVLPRIVELLPSLATSPTIHALWTPVAVEMDASRVEATLSALCATQHAAEHGVHIVGTRFPISLQDHDGYRESTVAALRWACCPLASTHCVKTHELDVFNPLYSMPSLLSAAQLNPSLTRVVVENRLENTDPVHAARRRSAWRWIAYAFLSRHANPNVQHLELPLATFTEDDLLAMAEIILAANPLATLFEVPSPNSPAFVWASVFYLVDPVHGDPHDEKAVFRLTTLIQVRLINRPTDPDHGWWRVLLPGKGEAWLCDKDRSKNAPPGIVTLLPVLEIALECLSHGSMKPSRGLLRLLHHRIHGLKVANSRDWSDDWLQGVLESCTGVERLTLTRSAAVRVETLAEWYRSGVCHATELTLSCHDTVVLDAFRDECHPLAVRVGVLHLELNFFRDHEGAMAAVDAALAMLANNKRLHTVSFSFDARNNTLRARDIDSIRAALGAYDGEILPVQMRSMDVRAKVAFLSVVARWGQWLDSAVAAVVFAFAAPCHVRHVRVELPSREMLW